MPAHEPSLDGFCFKGCDSLASAAVALADFGAMHSFASQAIIDKHGLPVHQVDSMQVTLADGHVVHSKATCVISLVVCVEQESALYSAVPYNILDKLSLDVVLGISWLSLCNPIVDWEAYTVALPVHGEQLLRVCCWLACWSCC